jgi:hypothetical protein
VPMNSRRNLQPQGQLVAALIWNDIASRMPLIGRIRCILHQNAFFDTSTFSKKASHASSQQPRSSVCKEPTAMAYKAGEGTPQRLPTTTNNPRTFLPLTTSMTTMLRWNPVRVCGIEVSPNGGLGFCCGMTQQGAPCKIEDNKIRHQRLNTLAIEPFDLSTLHSKLCDIARYFLCARWHRQWQADQVGEQWYEAAVRNQARVPPDSGVCSPSIVHPGQR